MRSRYSAYALGLADYVLETTHPDGEHFRTDTEGWRESVAAFSRGSEFVGLEILEAEGETVTFHADLRQGERDASFDECSTFKKANGRWAYFAGAPS